MQQRFLNLGEWRSTQVLTIWTFLHLEQSIYKFTDCFKLHDYLPIEFNA